MIIIIFFFNDPASPEIYILSLHDALPILYAALLNNVLVLAVAEARISEKDIKRQYFCPQCYREVQLINNSKTPYFKHIPSEVNLSGENKEHAQSKSLLTTALRAAHFNAQMEVQLANGQLRADRSEERRVGKECRFGWSSDP